MHVARCLVGTLAFVGGLSLAGCGAGATAAHLHDVAPAWPDSAESRVVDARELGRELFVRLQSGQETQLLLTDAELEELLEPEALTQARRRRGLVASSSAEARQAWRNTTFHGICLQGVRQEPPGTAVGLRAEAGVVERVLVVGRRPDRARLATWVEGLLVRTPRGLRAIAFFPIEPPRWEHSDLEIASCDVVFGLR